MASMDIFGERPFHMMELTTGLENLQYRPSLLRSSALFTPKPMRTKMGGIEMRDGTLTLIPFSDQGAPKGELNGDPRELVDFRTRHFTQNTTIWASEIRDIRAFGSETELQQVMNEVAYRSQKLRNNAELTHEYHMLNAIQGMVKNTNGDVVYNWYTKFGLSEADEIDFDLDNAAPKKGALRLKCTEVANAIEDDLAGNFPGDIKIGAVCGKTFWEQLTGHPDCIEAWLHAQKLEELSGRPTKEFYWGGIYWRRYRSGGGVGLDATKCRLFPMDVPELFQFATSPAEDFSALGQPGLESYYRTIPDRDRNSFIKLEIESNPMYLCTRPQALRKGRNT